MHLKQPEFFDIACRPFTNHRERTEKSRETRNLQHLYRNKLGKAWFVHEAAYSDSKDLTQGTISDKIVKDVAYEIDRNRGYDWYQRVLVSMVNKIFDKKTGSWISVNEQLAK